MSSSGRGPRTGRPSRPSGKSTGSRGAPRSYARGRKDVRGQKGQSDARRQMYRRRRLTVAFLAIIVAAVLTVGVVLAVQGIRDDLSAPPPVTETPDPTAPGPEGDAASGACPTDTTSVAASTDEDEYEPGEEPVLSIEVTNGHTADCLIDVGEARQEFLVERDGDTVWSSRYCGPADDEGDGEGDEGAEKNLLVFPAKSSKKASLTWPRIPVDDACRQTDDAFPAGEYELIVKLGEEESEPVPFTLASDPDEDDADDAEDGDGTDGDGND